MNVLTSYALVALVTIVAAAPTDKELWQHQMDYLRGKRSHYGVHYVSPCAAAAAASTLPGYGPPYHYDVAPMHGGYVVPHYDYAGPHYRSVDASEEPELLDFSEMNHIMQEHVPMARYGTYGTVPAHATGPMVVPAPVPAHSAYGIFPNANSGGCDVPLLFSCSPSIVQGRIVQPHQQLSPFGAAGDLYRGVTDAHMELHGSNQEEPSHDHSAMSHEPSHISLPKQ